MRIQSKTMAGLMTASLVILASVASIPARADTVGITYSFSGLEQGKPPVVIGTTLFLDGTVTGGSVVTADPGLNAIWNPVTFHDTCEADLLTGVLTGVFTFTFADGDTLAGSILEDVSAVLPTQSGPYSGTLTFTGGTGQFAGATGSGSIAGVIGAESTAFGSGTVSATGITPEPASIALFGTGLLGFGAFARNKLLRMRGQ
jgi:hypothetical protein